MKHTGDCGCGGHAWEADLSSEFGELGDEPNLQEMEQALNELAGEAEDVSLELAGLEGALEAAEADFAFATDETDLPTLGSLLAVAERYPGLKITFSF